MLLCILFLLKTTFSDPGVIPRGNLENPINPEQKLQEVENNKPEATQSIVNPQSEQPKVEIQENKENEVKF